MTVKTSYKEATEGFGGLNLWQATCDVCKGYIDLTQGGNPSQLQALMIKNHKYCGQGWDKQFSLIKEKHHYQCKCGQCIGLALKSVISNLS